MDVVDNRRDGPRYRVRDTACEGADTFRYCGGDRCHYRALHFRLGAVSFTRRPLWEEAVSYVALGAVGRRMLYIGRWVGAIAAIVPIVVATAVYAFTGDPFAIFSLLVEVLALGIAGVLLLLHWSNEAHKPDYETEYR